MKVYSVQILVDGFGNDTYVAFLGDSHEACENWVKNHPNYIKEKEYIILEHTLNDDEFRNYYTE